MRNIFIYLSSIAKLFLFSKLPYIFTIPYVYESNMKIIVLRLHIHILLFSIY